MGRSNFDRNCQNLEEPEPILVEIRLHSVELSRIWPSVCQIWTNIRRIRSVGIVQNLANSWPNIDRIRPDFGRTWPGPVQFLALSVEVAPDPAKGRPMLANVDVSRRRLCRFRRNSDPSRPNLDEFHQRCTDFGHCSSGRFGANFVEIGADMAECTRNQPTLVNIWPDSVQLRPKLPIFGRVRVRFGRDPAELGRARPNVAERVPDLDQSQPMTRTCGHSWTDFARNLYVLNSGTLFWSLVQR